MKVMDETSTSGAVRGDVSNESQSSCASGPETFYLSEESEGKRRWRNGIFKF